MLVWRRAVRSASARSGCSGPKATRAPLAMPAVGKKHGWKPGPGDRAVAIGSAGAFKKLFASSAWAFHARGASQPKTARRILAEGNSPDPLRPIPASPVSRLICIGRSAPAKCPYCDSNSHAPPTRASTSSLMFAAFTARSPRLAGRTPSARRHSSSSARASPSLNGARRRWPPFSNAVARALGGAPTASRSRWKQSVESRGRPVRATGDARGQPGVDWRAALNDGPT